MCAGTAFAEDGTAKKPAYRKVLRQVVRACRARDGAQLYKLMSPALRAEMEEEAQRRAKMDLAEVAKGYGYPGTIAQLDGPTFVKVMLHADASFLNPCWGAKRWKQVASDGTADQRVVFYELPDGLFRGILLQRRDGKWELAKFAKTMRREELQQAGALPAGP